ncbi:MAG: permease prefix domain 1-containing protein [Acidobacteriaceae bacterium]
MAKQFHELRERLLRGGVAPRHVRRYLTELREHWADLTAEEMRAGRSPAEAETAALERLGRVEDLAQTMIARRELRSWTARAPWAVLGAGPVVAMVGGWAVALGILWTGWTWFLQGRPTPFVPVHGFAMVYFGVGRMLYYGAPLLAGWGIVLLAGRQRVRAAWPVMAGAILVALLGATGDVDVRPPAVPGQAGDVGIRFYPLPAQMGDAAVHAMVLLTLVVLPYLVWRWMALRSAVEGE